MPASNPSTPPVLPTYGNSAGMIPVSGIAPSGGNYPGPHFVETQSMNIKFVRVPVRSCSSIALSLSTVPVTYTVTDTWVAAIVEASYRVLKDMNTYSTSGYQQNQKFAVIPEGTDPYGNSYDSLSGLGASAIGPMGEIVSQHVWYYRRPWNAATDNETDKYVNGSTYTMIRADMNIIKDCWGNPPQIEMPANWSQTLDWDSENVQFPLGKQTPPNMVDYRTPWPTRGYGSTVPPVFYTLQGPYDPDNEAPELIQNWVDNIGEVVSDKSLFGLGDDFKSSVNECATYGKRSEGIFKYSKLRHDWS